MKYLKLFENHTEYEAFKQTDKFIKPNVSHCVQENEVHYNPRTWADEYFTTVALESGTIDFTLYSWADTSFITSFAYSKNDGEWVETQNSDNRETNVTISVNVVEGDKVRWKGIANHIGDDGDNGGVFTSTCRFDAQGNIMSLLHGDDFNDKVTLENGYEFTYLFKDINTENNCLLVVNASNLILPATTLAESCYDNMFSMCTSLTTAPKLPATTLAEGCYAYMFDGCTSLVNVPVLPATTLTRKCYKGMFQDCTNLTTVPSVLPATTLAEYCYDSMFRGCTSLTTAPELPATTLADSCYIWMFWGCTSLVNVPVLPATTLVTGCYNEMFAGCTNLNYIKAMFTTTPSTDYTEYWVSGVASSGTFVKNAAATWNVTGEHGIPTGWTVETATA